MSRKRKRIVRPVDLDVRFNDETVSRFINCLMKQGKKAVAQRVFYGAMDIIEEKFTDMPALEVFRKAIDNARPVVEVKSRRVGGANYQVPIEVAPHRRQALAFRWLLQYSNERSENRMQERLAYELIDAAKGEGRTIRKRDDIHRMADANKAFAHYRY
jgi:small subunit ribosomal protein S7